MNVLVFAPPGEAGRSSWRPPSPTPLLVASEPGHHREGDDDVHHGEDNDDHHGEDHGGDFMMILITPLSFLLLKSSICFIRRHACN